MSISRSRGFAVGRGNSVPVGSPRVRFPMALLEFFIDTMFRTRMDLWHTAMGMYKTEQHCYNPEISKQSPQGHC